MGTSRRRSRRVSYSVVADEREHAQPYDFSHASSSAREFGLQAWQNRWPALLVACGFVVASLIIAACAPAHYKAIATLAVLPAPEFTVRPDAGSREQAATTLALDQVMKAETEILSSDDLHLAVLAEVGADKVYPGSTSRERSAASKFAHSTLDAIFSIWTAAPTDLAASKVEQELRRFRSDLLILPAKDSNIVAVSFTSKHPRQAATVVNTLLALYAIKRKQLYDDPQLDAIRREKAALEMQAADADRRLTAFRRNLDIYDFSIQRASLLQRESNSEQALADVSSLIAELEARTASISQYIHKEPASIDLYREADPDTRLQIAKTASQDIETRYAEAAERYTTGSRLLVRLRAQVEARRSAVQAMEKDQGASVSRRGRNLDRDQLKLDQQRALADLAAAKSRSRSLDAQCRELTRSLHDFDQGESALHSLEREKRSADENVSGINKLLSERHLTEAEDALRFANVRVIQPARVPQAAQPLAIYIVASGILIGLMAAGVWVTCVFVRREVFLSEQALADHFRIPVLATFSREVVCQGLEQTLI